MSMRRGWIVAPIVVMIALPGLAAAQNSIDRPSGRQRLREADKPVAAAKLDDALKKFNSTDRPERLEGIGLLGTLPNEAKAVQLLLEAVSDPDAAIALKSIDALGAMRTTEATPVLVQQLLLRDQPAMVKQHLLGALGQIGDPRATTPIVDLLARSSEAPVRGSAIFALGEIGDREALPPLERLATDTSNLTLQRLAGEASQKIKSRPDPTIQPPSLIGDSRTRPGARPR